MIRTTRPPEKWKGGWPRTSGDDPFAIMYTWVSLPLAPHERG